MADRVIVVSQSEKTLLTFYYPTVANRRVRIAGNGIDDCTIKYKNKITAKANQILYVGRFVDRKGIRDLFAAIPRVLERAPNTRFVLVGGQPFDSGKQMEQWWLHPELYRYRKHIKFTGWVSSSEVKAWYRSSDILVVPSWYEPFGMVILEGMQNGLAIVASNVGGPAEILKHGRTGLLFPPKDITALADTLLYLIGNPIIRRKIGDLAASEVREKWSWGNVIGKIESIYRECVPKKMIGFGNSVSNSTDKSDNAADKRA